MKLKKMIFSSLSCIVATTPIIAVIACSKEINVSDKDAYKGKTLSNNFKIPKGTKVIGESAFEDAKLPDNFSIPEGVTTIKKYAFIGVTFPKNFKLPESITSIEEGAFAGATFQTIFPWPENIKKLPNFVFSHAIFKKADDPTNYKNEPGVFIPNGITNFGKGSFNGVKFPAGFSVPITLKFVDSIAFGASDFTNVSPNFDFPPSMHYGPVVDKATGTEAGIFEGSKFNQNFGGKKTSYEDAMANAFLRGKPIFDGLGPNYGNDFINKDDEVEWLFYGEHKRDPNK